MAIVEYYVSGKLEAPLKPPQQNQCHQCAPIQDTAKVDDFDTERDAQVAWKWGALEMLNAAIKGLWPRMWNAYQCINNNCNTRHSCGNQPTYIRAWVVDIGVPDPTAPMGQKQVWRLCITLQRKIECIPAVPGTPEKDDPPEIYKKLPPPAEQPEPQPAPKAGEDQIPTLAPSVEGWLAKR